ncbi:MAG: Rrf2 family transcriptional regulator, partial [Patescibacteria group bacterium]
LALIGHLKEQGRAFVDVEKAAEASGLPKAYLEKVAQELKRAGWLESKKGSGGGYRLLKNPKSVSVKALIQLYSPIQAFCPLLRARKKK